MQPAHTRPGLTGGFSLSLTLKKKAHAQQQQHTLKSEIMVTMIGSVFKLASCQCGIMIPKKIRNEVNQGKPIVIQQHAAGLLTSSCLASLPSQDSGKQSRHEQHKIETMNMTRRAMKKGRECGSCLVNAEPAG